ncbi:CBS domain-containing protein [Rhodobacteraceae bacterium RKSG542]|uniref:CBS domain-containing protein n=1 Tax=Pseudovibrio flavus TaxID=2529854 RepID=UPI0012BB70F5|nr:CBS domain-containing protein [Pseudovibrio flavus]MTI19362.1 CBS domain-containing protein [Pseudovibrio flavus]
MTVSAVLGAKGRDVLTKPATERVGDICSELTERKIGAIVICDSPGVIAGIVSERDIVRAVATSGASVLEQEVSTIMTKEVVTCTEGETITAVMAKMTQGRFRHMPVVKDGKLEGIISIGDVVKHRIAEVEHEAELLKAYIHAS